MRNLRFTVFILSVLIGVFCLTRNSQAASSVHGAAWWGNDNGYLYFDCIDYETGSRLDSPNNFADPPDPLSFHFYIGGCLINHHTYINDNGNLSGSAFNMKVGLVNFGGVDTPVSVPATGWGFNVNCPSACNAANNCSACYNSATQRLYGWAQVALTGELIRLDYQPGPPANENFLQLKNWNMSSSTNPYYNVSPGDFVGHASSTFSGAQQSLSFNCVSENGVNNGGTCALRNYKAYISNPSVGKMSAPNWSYAQACSSRQARQAVLKWILKSGMQEGFEVVVTASDAIPADLNNAVCWSGPKVGSLATQYNVPNASDIKCKSESSLSYDTPYYWFVRLYYTDKGVSTTTPWYQFGVNDAHEGLVYDEDTNNDGNPKTFTTYKHEFPIPYFTWSPAEPLVGSTTVFNAITLGSSSQFFTDDSPIAKNCWKYPLSCLFSWTNSEPSPDISDPNASVTEMIFHRPSSTMAVTLTVRDNTPEQYSCSLTQILSINYGLPVWREVKAE